MAGKYPLNFIGTFAGVKRTPKMLRFKFFPDTDYIVDSQNWFAKQIDSSAEAFQEVFDPADDQSIVKYQNGELREQTWYEIIVWKSVNPEIFNFLSNLSYDYETRNKNRYAIACELIPTEIAGQIVYRIVAKQLKKLPEKVIDSSKLQTSLEISDFALAINEANGVDFETYDLNSFSNIKETKI